MAEQQQRFESWAIVEVMGHRQLAGFVTERVIAGQAFVQVDVPETTGWGGEVISKFTQMFGPSSIYCLTPCDEATAKAAAGRFRQKPFAELRLSAVQALPAPTPQEEHLGDPPFDDEVGHDELPELA